MGSWKVTEAVEWADPNTGRTALFMLDKPVMFSSIDHLEVIDVDKRLAEIDAQLETLTSEKAIVESLEQVTRHGMMDEVHEDDEG